MNKTPLDIGKLGKSFGKFRIIPFSCITLKHEKIQSDIVFTYSVLIKTKIFTLEINTITHITNDNSYSELFVKHQFANNKSDGHVQLGKEKYSIATITQPNFIEDKVNKYLNTLGINELKDYTKSLPEHMYGHKVLEELDTLAKNTLKTNKYSTLQLNSLDSLSNWHQVLHQTQDSKDNKATLDRYSVIKPEGTYIMKKLSYT